MSRIAVIIVTHNSKAVIGRGVVALDKQVGPPVSVIVVDSGSRDQGYLRVVGDRHLAGDVEYVVFLNPDVFVEPDTLRQAVRAGRGPGSAPRPGRENGMCGRKSLCLSGERNILSCLKACYVTWPSLRPTI